jgi:hypothetical protein
MLYLWGTIQVVPITVSIAENDVVAVRGVGASLPHLILTNRTFWETLFLGNGLWIWDYILDRTSEPVWLKAALERSAILAKDSFYS